MNAALAVLAAFLLGSIPWALVVGRASRGVDVRLHGSGNLGATNVFRVLGPRDGAIVLALDMAKGAAGVIAARLATPVAATAAPGATSVQPVGWVEITAALAAVLGHVFSPWVRFRGGKGVATAGGAFLALAPAATLLVLAVWSVVFALGRIVSLASIVAAVALPLVLLARHAPPAVVALAVPVSLLVLARHLPNMKRLAAGRESRVRFGRRPPSPSTEEAPRRASNGS